MQSNVQDDEVTQEVLDNPDNPCPPEILMQIRPVRIAYWGFDGRRHSGVIEVHADVVRDVVDFFAYAYEIEFPISSVVRSSDPAYLWNDEKLMADNTTSGFNYRLIAHSDKTSLHGQGRAIDVNTWLNPYIRYTADGPRISPAGAIWNPKLPGTLHAAHPLVLFMNSRGWTWGGDWGMEYGATDYQHFEKPDYLRV